MNMNNNFNTGERIHELRTQQGLSQEQLALRAEITPTYLGLVERNLKNPTIKIIEQICNSLNIGLADFFNTSMKPTETIDSVTTQILAQLSDMSLKEKELILQIVKNIIRLQMISDKPR
jgi:transcriptional regulator with XRE-family HTH domain